MKIQYADFISGWIRKKLPEFLLLWMNYYRNARDANILEEKQKRYIITNENKVNNYFSIYVFLHTKSYVIL